MVLKGVSESLLSEARSKLLSTHTPEYKKDEESTLRLKKNVAEKVRVPSEPAKRANTYMSKQELIKKLHECIPVHETRTRLTAQNY